MKKPSNSKTAFKTNTSANKIPENNTFDKVVIKNGT